MNIFYQIISYFVILSVNFRLNVHYESISSRKQVSNLQSRIHVISQ